MKKLKIVTFAVVCMLIILLNPSYVNAANDFISSGEIYDIKEISIDNDIYYVLAGDIKIMC